MLSAQPRGVGDGSNDGSDNDSNYEDDDDEDDEDMREIRRRNADPYLKKHRPHPIPEPETITGDETKFIFNQQNDFGSTCVVRTWDKLRAGLPEEADRCIYHGSTCETWTVTAEHQPVGCISETRDKEHWNVFKETGAETAVSLFYNWNPQKILVLSET